MVVIDLGDTWLLLSRMVVEGGDDGD